MQDQVQQQFDQFQNGFKSVFEAGQKVSEPALRSSEVALDSLSQLAQDQFDFGHACLEISRKQMESLHDTSDVSTLFSNNGAMSEYYNASLRYGEALRKNAENTRDRMLAIGRESADAVAEAGNELSKTAAETGDKMSETAAEAGDEMSETARKSASSKKADTTSSKKADTKNG